MTWVDLSSAFGYGTTLTSTQMQNLRDNTTAAFAGDSGAPTLSGKAMGSIAVGTNYTSPILYITYDESLGTETMVLSTATTSTSYVERFNGRILQSGTYRVKFKLKTNNASAIAYGRIYKNGAAFGTEQYTSAVLYQQYTEDLTFTRGDTIQLFVKSSSASYYTTAYYLTLGYDATNTPLIAPPISLFVAER